MAKRATQDTSMKDGLRRPAGGRSVQDSRARRARSHRPSAAQAQTRKKGGTIRVAFVGSPVKLDPHIAAGSEEWAMLRNVYDSLVWTDEQLTAKPELAVSWESSPDATGVDVQPAQGCQVPSRPRIRRGRRRIQLHADPRPCDRVAARSVFSMVDKVESSPRWSCGSRSSQPFAEFPQLCGGSFQAKIAPARRRRSQQESHRHGAFKLTEFVAGDHVTLVRNDAYWRDGEPYLDQVPYRLPAGGRPRTSPE
jgi:MarR-like DNA-binding transcriptional regulator SgrR of sgrS sRNA